MMEHIWKLQEFCNSMAKLETDSYEYAYLKAIVLFSPGKHVPDSLLTQAKVLQLAFFLAYRIYFAETDRCLDTQTAKCTEIVDSKHVGIGRGLCAFLNFVLYCVFGTCIVLCVVPWS